MPLYKINRFVKKRERVDLSKISTKPRMDFIFKNTLFNEDNEEEEEEDKEITDFDEMEDEDKIDEIDEKEIEGEEDNYY